ASGRRVWVALKSEGWGSSTGPFLAGPKGFHAPAQAQRKKALANRAEHSLPTTHRTEGFSDHRLEPLLLLERSSTDTAGQEVASCLRRVHLHGQDRCRQEPKVGRCSRLKS